MALSDLLSVNKGTQAELAQRIGVHPGTITVWKHRPPREAMAHAIAAAVGRPVDVVVAAIREARAQPAVCRPTRPEPATEFGKAVTGWLAAQGLVPFTAQAALAATDTTIAGWAAGRTLPPRSRLPAIAIALGRTVDELTTIVAADRAARLVAPEQGDASMGLSPCADPSAPVTA